MATIQEAAAEFLSHKRVAVTGVSRTASGHGANTVYKRLRDRGYEVFAVNPNAEVVEGDPCYRRLAIMRAPCIPEVVGSPNPTHQILIWNLQSV